MYPYHFTQEDIEYYRDEWKYINEVIDAGRGKREPAYMDQQTMQVYLRITLYDYADVVALKLMGY